MLVEFEHVVAPEVVSSTTADLKLVLVSGKKVQFSMKLTQRVAKAFPIKNAISRKETAYQFWS